MRHTEERAGAPAPRAAVVIARIHGVLQALAYLVLLIYSLGGTVWMAVHGEGNVILYWMFLAVLIGLWWAVVLTGWPLHLWARHPGAGSAALRRAGIGGLVLAAIYLAPHILLLF